MFLKAANQEIINFWELRHNSISKPNSEHSSQGKKTDLAIMTALFAAKQIAGTLKSPCAATVFRFQKRCNFFGVKNFQFEHG